MLQCTIALCLAATFAGGWGLFLTDAEFVSKEFHPLDGVFFLLELGFVVIGVATVICFSKWNYRSYANLEAMNVVDRRTTPGWAVGWYFVPFANLVMPFRVMKDLYNGSQGVPVQTSASVVNSWWVLWLMSLALAIASDAMMESFFDSQTTAKMMRQAVVVMIIAEAAAIYAALMAIKIVTDVTDAQERFYEQAA